MPTAEEAAAPAALQPKNGSCVQRDAESYGILEGRPGEAGEKSWQQCLQKMVGPGLLVCLADTDAGCMIVAAQSGAKWEYSLLLLQFALIPVLYAAQELTIRLGIHTRKGLTACVREHLGPGWAWFAAVFLVLECTGAILSEMSGIAAVAELWDMSRNKAACLSALVIVLVVTLCRYRQIETIGVALGLFELVFVGTMTYYKPPPREVVKGMFVFHSDAEYLLLIAANIGAVVMPWMIFFQQSAVVARRLKMTELNEERAHTLFGSFLTQLIMISLLVTLAVAKTQSGDLEHVADIAKAMAPVLGEFNSKLILSLGFVGGSLCAAFVVSLAATWSICEAMGKDEQFSLDASPVEAPLFYFSFFAIVGAGLAVLLTGVSVVRLNIFVELMDGMLLPFTLGFLFLLATSEILPPGLRVMGVQKAVIGLMFLVCTALSVVTGVWSVALF
eukprot:TRINITY_DN29694_c0_g1_i1.p1 TRINITY_DN29694_c0_g1~~TRINITY_DN29694_c0_g1_i1.p1  ORF type:complete len:446 (+),score=108.30 TRINITY_DN29694_c0_g1_i1:114-1451(+)